MNKSSLNINTGRFFPIPVIILGYLGLAFGVVSLFYSIIQGIVIVGISFILSFTTSGLEVKQTGFRHYIAFLSFRFGKWQKLEYRQISILKKRLGQRVYGGRTNISMNKIDVYYEITLLSECHRGKQKLLRLKNIDEAKVKMNEISTFLNLTPVNYNPKKK